MKKVIVALGRWDMIARGKKRVNEREVFSEVIKKRKKGNKKRKICEKTDGMIYRKNKSISRVLN